MRPTTIIAVEISSKDARYNLARERARTLLTLTRQRPPVNVDLIIERAGVPVVERVLEDGVRATVGDVAGRPSIILNRGYEIRSAGERRWILAEELGHVLLGHALVNSTAPGSVVIGLLEAQRVAYEREARAFAAELLMPFAEVSRRWFALLREQPEQSAKDRIRRLASEFGVTPTAMRVRVEQMRLFGQ
jgi:Zn-dependent peptidase ImmA (M78 family)